MQGYKTDFPLLMQDKTVYIDNAATAQRPKCVIDAEKDFYTCHNANPLRGIYELSVQATEDYENARKAVRDFIGAKSVQEIIFTRNTTESINLVAYSYGLSNLKKGDEVVVSIMEHHSDLLPWQMVCRQTGAELKFLECEKDGSLDLNKAEELITDRTKIVAVTQLSNVLNLDEVREQITEKTRIVAITQVSNVLGRVNPVKEIAAMAHEKNAVVVVDGAQSTPHIAVDVKKLGVDFFAFSGHKLYGPMGIGVLYGRRELLEKMPPFLTGGEMIESVSRTSAVYAELPHKFEAGTVNAAGAVGLKSAIDYVKSVGFEEIHKRELEVSAYAFEKMKEIAHINILGTEKAEEHNGILTFTVDNVHPHDVSEILAADGIAVRAGHHCAQPLLEYLGYRSTVRASFAFYNTKEDADRFLDSLSTVRERMGYGK